MQSIRGSLQVRAVPKERYQRYSRLKIGSKGQLPKSKLAKLVEQKQDQEAVCLAFLFAHHILHTAISLSILHPDELPGALSCTHTSFNISLIHYELIAKS